MCWTVIFLVPGAACSAAPPCQSRPSTSWQRDVGTLYLTEAIVVLLGLSLVVVSTEDLAQKVFCKPRFPIHLPICIRKHCKQTVFQMFYLFLIFMWLYLTDCFEKVWRQFTIKDSLCLMTIRYILWCKFKRDKYHFLEKRGGSSHFYWTSFESCNEITTS